MRKGIVMEVDDSYLTLLTPDGEFLRARKVDKLYSIGDEIDFFPVPDSIRNTKTFLIKNFFSLKTVWMSFAVLIICAGSLIPMYQSNKAYAYMSIDASTSIEMGLNKKMQVVELKGFNKEAEKIISDLDDWKKKDASELTAIILSELKDEGYIAKAEPVVISTVKTHQLKDKVATRLQENIDEIKQTTDKNLLEVNMYTTTEEELEKARNSGMPVGTYQKSKNQSAQKEKNKEKVKSTQLKKNKNKIKTITPSETSAESTLPPGQIKKDDQDNNPGNQNQGENNQNNIVKHNSVEMQQHNENQASPGNNNGNEKQKQNQENVNQKQDENNNNHKNQEKQKTNNQNKSNKQDKSGKK
jgi:hypothetical protein